MNWMEMLSVPCPTCGASKDHQCIGPGGNTVGYVHSERYIAWEKHSEQETSETSKTSK